MSEAETPWYEKVSRDPSDYTPTDHAMIRTREKSIPTERLGEVIEDGIMQQARNGYPMIRFLLDDEEFELPLGLTVNAEEGCVVTAYWDTDHNHPKHHTDE